MCYRKKQKEPCRIVAERRHLFLYKEYFNLTPEIVCVNAIGSNIQQRLNGCDYDSDTMLITDNIDLLNAAQTSYQKFPVPYCAVAASERTDLDRTKRGLADLDIQIAENYIGEIVNLSQFLNSLFWNEIAKTHRHNRPLYYDICKLAVLSGMEIDKAKRTYEVDANAEIGSLRKRKNAYLKDNPLPRFYKEVTDSKRSVPIGTQALIDAPMEYLFAAVENEKRRSNRCEPVTLRSLLRVEACECGHNDSRDKWDIIGTVTEAAQKLGDIQRRLHGESRDKAAADREEMARIVSECFRAVSKKIRTQKVIMLLVDELDKEDSKVSECSSLLLAALCHYNNGYFYDLIEASRDENITELVQDENGLEEIYGVAYTRVIRRLAHKAQ